jgi:hypothetical protein
MSPIDFFLFLKKKNIHILTHLEEIIGIYEDILDNIDDHSDLIKSDLFGNEINTKKEYEKQIVYLKTRIMDINDKIFSMCHHDFLDDTIDITTEKSQKITYCTICEYTSP